MEYLINVALSFVPSLISGVVFWFLISFIMKRLEVFKDKPVYKENGIVLAVFLCVALAFSMMSPSITYKHQTFDKEREDYQIELLKQQEQERTDLVIQDRTRLDHSVTDEEWEAKSSYKKSE